MTYEVTTDCKRKCFTADIFAAIKVIDYVVTILRILALILPTFIVRIQYFILTY